MDDSERYHIDLLRQKVVPADFVKSLYGVDLSASLTREAYERWLAARRRGPSEAGTVDRWQFESFIQANRLEPLKFAAAGMGMRWESLEEILGRLESIGLVRSYQPFPGLVEEGLSDDLVRTLPTTKFRTFGDHESYCLRLHKDLYDALHVKVRELRCATSAQLHEYPYRFAKTFDYITLEPLSLRHQVLLDFGKPMNLALDRCSKLFYAQNRDVLKEFVAGSHEPEDWREYLVEAKV